MSGDIVYADLQNVRASPLEHSSPVPRPDSHHHGILLKIGCTMITVLLIIIITLSIFVIQYKSARHTEVDNEFKESLCDRKNKSGTISSIVSSNSSTAHKSCPNKDWKLHGGKCYWVSTHKKSWIESRNDCATKNSQLMVIRDFIDMSFLWLHLSRSDYYWIGLSIPTKEKPWVWVDNNSFDPHLFSIEEGTPQTRSLKCAQGHRHVYKSA
ncbi:killer cell lectin-like receptor subfamily F member 1 isoform X2 [Desmodus rotundus]|uniref:killer cell lectin-like receptor subfamily F member 1 isoform X2 n=1 Tax=Desmodus rotundus TaxID=9430 RepID=UPI002380C7DE|nr:killer cell lectin-like receptor subfamily F member 1 isoform X2 [Desmodus rotundus]